MAVEQTIVYKDVYRLVSEIIDHIQDMPVKHRRTLGDRILNISYGLLETLHFAYGSKEGRVRYLDKFQIEFGQLQTLLRIANEKKWIYLNHMTSIAEQAAKISSQIGAWRKKSIENSERGA